jgi:hypothetical protein
VSNNAEYQRGLTNNRLIEGETGETRAGLFFSLFFVCLLATLQRDSERRGLSGKNQVSSPVSLVSPADLLASSQRDRERRGC